MIKRAIFLILFVVSSVIFNPVYSADSVDNTLMSISPKIDSYNNKEIELVLRLKKVDYTMRTITFYDSENVDVIFDIDRYEKKPLIKKSLLNIHEGVKYRVKFLINGKDTDGLIKGILVEFNLFFLEKVP